MLEGRLTPEKKHGDESSISPEWQACFSLKQPLILDLGCGNGVFLAALAERYPEKNFLGIEKKPYRVRQSHRRVGALPNAHVLEGEVMDVLRGLPRESVLAVYLLFNDPWPKRRHAGRRLVQREFVSWLATCLAPRGAFFFATDSLEYARYARETFVEAGWGIKEWVPPEDWPTTEFERRFAAEGLEAYRFQATPV